MAVVAIDRGKANVQIVRIGKAVVSDPRLFTQMVNVVAVALHL